MTARLRIAFLILITMYLFAGCISTGDEMSETQTPIPIDKSAIEAEEVKGATDLELVEDIKCTVVTQYGGETKSCSGQISSEDEDPESTPVSYESLRPVVGKWQIAYGNLSSFPNLHFTGEAEFRSDGTYKITTHPLEFDPAEGLLDYSGNYNLEDSEIEGSGKSSIYQEGQVFGATAVDKISAQLDNSASRLEGHVTSVSSFHDGGGGENATFNFVLEKG
jgi:hypothetical protein